ncbi:MAG: 23S rRNA (adenine(2503)-C(2))-methyltransferase RlmN [Acidobacteriota bacterium]|jgi:23S rRNA (adenine2503-C2)-methyltransferase
MKTGVPNLVGASLAEVAAVLAPVDPRPYRARQVYHWVTRRLVARIEEMTDLSRALRSALAERAVLTDPQVVEVCAAPDGTTKFVLEMADGATVEAVTMPMGDRTTLCLSSQAGCAVGCVFCVTGALGAGRNLTAGEIFGQYRVLVRHGGLAGAPLNVVFMGMGEPLLNCGGVFAALDLLYETVSPKRVTLSTSGIPAGFAQLRALPRRPNLAVSLNATTQEQRLRLMPVAARWPLEDLLQALRAYPLERGRRITIEYVLLAGENDSLADARRLVRLLRGIPVKVNLIPFNPDPEFLPHLTTPSAATVDAFGACLAEASLNVTVRWSKGREVLAACGQLRGRVARSELPARFR